MRVTATEAKNRFGSLCAQAKKEPVLVEKGGRIDTVILSAERFEELLACQSAGEVSARRRAFEREFAEWIAQTNRAVEAEGIPLARQRPW